MLLPSSWLLFQNLADTGFRDWSRFQLGILAEVLRDSPCRRFLSLILLAIFAEQ